MPAPPQPDDLRVSQEAREDSSAPLGDRESLVSFSSVEENETPGDDVPLDCSIRSRVSLASQNSQTPGGAEGGDPVGTRPSGRGKPHSNGGGKKSKSSGKSGSDGLLSSFKHSNKFKHVKSRIFNK